MSLLAALAQIAGQGIGGGMVANAKEGFDIQAQAKQEAADAAKQAEQLKFYREDMNLRSSDSKADREARAEEERQRRAADAEQRRLDRLSAEKIAGMRQSGSASNTDELRGLKWVDSTISGIDSELYKLSKAYDEAMTPDEKSSIASQAAALRERRKSFITNPATLKILDSSGEWGQAYKASLFTPEQDNPAPYAGPLAQQQPEYKPTEPKRWSGNSDPEPGENTPSYGPGTSAAAPVGGRLWDYRQLK